MLIRINDVAPTITTPITAASQSTSTDLQRAEGYAFTVQVTASSPTGCSIFLQVSNDNVNWQTLPNSSQSISASGNFLLTDNRPFYRYARVAFAISGGSLTAVAIQLTVKQ